MLATWDFWSPTGFQTAFPDRAREHPHCPSVRQMAAGTASFTDGETEGRGRGGGTLSVATQLMGVSGRGSGIMVPLSSPGPQAFPTHSVELGFKSLPPRWLLLC